MTGTIQAELFFDRINKINRILVASQCRKMMELHNEKQG
jgi:hypothetical protein